MNMAFVVHRNFKYQHVGPLDHRINHLPVDEIDVRHAEEESEILAVGIFYVALDPPLGFFDGNDRIAKYDVIVHCIPVALVHEAHMRIVERVSMLLK